MNAPADITDADAALVRAMIAVRNALPESSFSVNFTFVDRPEGGRWTGYVHRCDRAWSFHSADPASALVGALGAALTAPAPAPGQVAQAEAA